MRLLLIRHGKAADRDEWARDGKDDAHRPLTPEGKKQMKAAAKGLRRIVKRIDLLATSPFVRAQQTAALLYAAYDGKPEFTELPLLAGGHAMPELIRWIKDHDLDAATVAFVGHEPDIGRWTAWCLTGKPQPIVTVKKGTVAVVDFPGRLAAGKGVLAGLYHAKDLRRN